MITCRTLCHYFASTNLNINVWFTIDRLVNVINRRFLLNHHKSLYFGEEANRLHNIYKIPEIAKEVHARD